MKWASESFVDEDESAIPIKNHQRLTRSKQRDLKQWEGHGIRSLSWAPGTFVGAAIWSILSLGFTFCASYFMLVVWSIGVISQVSVNSWNEPKPGLTRAEVSGSIFSAWWPAIAIVAILLLVRWITSELFGNSDFQSRRFARFLLTICALLLFGIWAWFALEIWRQYGAPLSQ